VGRSKEAGIRKVLGSNRHQLIGQVMGETFLIVLFAVILAIALANTAMPFLKYIASVPDGLSLFNSETIPFLIIVLIVVTLLSGIYPSLIVSGFKPVLALKSKITSASIGGISLRRILVVTQFVISQILIIGTIVAISQMNFVRNADLGFNKETGAAAHILIFSKDSRDFVRLSSVFHLPMMKLLLITTGPPILLLIIKKMKDMLFFINMQMKIT